MRTTSLFMANSTSDSRQAPGFQDANLSLLPSRVSIRYPHEPVGKHIRFRCDTTDGQTFFCKSDADGRPIRAIEWFCHGLTKHLGIAVAPFAVVEDNDGQTYFGSRLKISTAEHFEMLAYLTQAKINELGGKSDWLGRHLSMLYVIDMFLNNDDRNINNFILDKGGMPITLRAIDFADGDPGDISGRSFPVAASNTVCNGRFLASVHGFHPDAASEMINRIRAVPVAAINGIFGGMPDEWIDNEWRNSICGSWADQHHFDRLSALLAGINDGTLL